jgi:hypothetical protein
MLAMDWGGGESTGRVICNRLMTVACFSCVALHRATNLSPTALSLLYSLLHVGNILRWICFRRLKRLSSITI